MEFTYTCPIDIDIDELIEARKYEPNTPLDVFLHNCVLNEVLDKIYEDYKPDDEVYISDLLLAQVKMAYLNKGGK